MAPCGDHPQYPQQQVQPPVQGAPPAHGTLQRSQQVGAGEQQHQPTLHAPQRARFQATPGLQVEGRPRGKGPHQEHQGEQRARAGQRHGISATEETGSHGRESARSFQGAPSHGRSKTDRPWLAKRGIKKGRLPATGNRSRAHQARAGTGKGAANRRSSSNPRPSWNSWLLRSVSPSCASRRASSAQASGLRSRRRLLSR